MFVDQQARQIWSLCIRGAIAVHTKLDVKLLGFLLVPSLSDCIAHVLYDKYRLQYVAILWLVKQSTSVLYRRKVKRCHQIFLMAFCCLLSFLSHCHVIPMWVQI